MFTTTRRAFIAILTTGLLAFALGGCGKPTIEGAKKRYTETKDRIEVLGTKNPMMKMDIAKKVAEFEVEAKAAEAKGGEEAISALNTLVSRMEKYEKELKPQEAPKAGAPAAGQPGAKLGGAQAPAAPVAPTPAAPVPAAPGGKLGGPGAVPAAPVAPAPAAPSGGSGFGGK